MFLLILTCKSTMIQYAYLLVCGFYTVLYYSRKIFTIFYASFVAELWSVVGISITTYKRHKYTSSSVLSVTNQRLSPELQFLASALLTTTVFH